ncbi:30S ribosomal protein S20 [Sorangium sp. So ce887]|uniref:30S ribosomal protein S20 n=1 Tax=Sorangium sp. So ce887 TaxID=3133324 RepID=UPI003F62E359
MANHASAEKRNRQRITRTARNRAIKSELRTVVKKARTALKGVSQESTAPVNAAESALDRAASKGAIPAKRASRVKSRLALALHKASITAKTAAS